MRFLRRWISLGLVLLVLAGGFLVGQILTGGSFGGEMLRGLGIVRETRQQSNAANLSEVEDVLRLLTARSLSRVVFPYDFLPEGQTVETIIAKLLDPAETATEDVRIAVEAISLAQELGFRLGRDFAVIPLDVRIGFDLAAGFAVTEDEESISVVLPQPQILGVTVEDFDSEAYPYPVPAVSAEAFSRAAAFVAERAAGLLVSTEADAAISAAVQQLQALLAPIAEGRDIRILVSNTVSQ